MPHQEKFSEKSVWAFLSRNQTREGVESKVDAQELKGFQDGVDLLFLDAIEQTNRKKEREGERQTEKYQAQININKIEKRRYVCMKNA